MTSDYDVRFVSKIEENVCDDCCYIIACTVFIKKTSSKIWSNSKSFFRLLLSNFGLTLIKKNEDSSAKNQWSGQSFGKVNRSDR